MRGTLLFSCNRPLHSPSAPAHAGHTINAGLGVTPNAFSPRTCGAHRPGSCRKGAYPLQPPHMRGTQLGDSGSGRPSSSAPAHAGHITNRSTLAELIDFSPRTCGAHLAGIKRPSRRVLQPPHMRGTRWDSWWTGWDSTSAPAHAGHTIWVTYRRDLTSFSPRTCGAHNASH